MQALLDYLTAHPWLLWLVAGALSLLLARRSQVDAWVEMHPRVGGFLKLLRSFGIDPWLLLQGLSLLVRGRLPAPPPTKPTSKLPPPLAVMCAGLIVSSCSSWKPAARTVNDVARDLCSMFFAERQSLSLEEAAEAACETREQLDPWIREVLAAKQSAGAAATK